MEPRDKFEHCNRDLWITISHVCVTSVIVPTITEVTHTQNVCDSDFQLFMFAFILPLALSDEEVVFDYEPGRGELKPAVVPYDIIPISIERAVDPSSFSHENRFINLKVASQEDTSNKGEGDEELALTIVPEEHMKEIMTGIKRIENQTIDYVSHLIKENEDLTRQIEVLKGKIEELNQIINKLLEEKNAKN